MRKEQKSNKIKAIIFDIGDVLALSKHPLKKYKNKTHHLGIHESVAKKLNISLDQYFDSIDTAYTKSIEGKISKKQAIEILSKNLKISKKELIKIYYQVYNQEFKQNYELLKEAFELKKLGYKIAVLSDQWHLSKEALIPKSIYKNFNVVAVSCDIGIRKPNLEAYKLVLKKLKIQPKQALFIDNQQWNIFPAKKLGMKTILFKNNLQLFKEKIWRNLLKK